MCVWVCVFALISIRARFQSISPHDEYCGKCVLYSRTNDNDNNWQIYKVTELCTCRVVKLIYLLMDVLIKSSFQAHNTDH